MSDWTEWAEGLAAASRRAGNENATAADFPKGRVRWTKADECEGRDNDFDPLLSDYLSDRDAERLEP